MIHGKSAQIDLLSLDWIEIKIFKTSRLTFVKRSSANLSHDLFSFVTSLINSTANYAASDILTRSSNETTKTHDNVDVIHSQPTPRVSFISERSPTRFCWCPHMGWLISNFSQFFIRPSGENRNWENGKHLSHSCARLAMFWNGLCTRSAYGRFISECLSLSVSKVVSSLKWDSKCTGASTRLLTWHFLVFWIARRHRTNAEYQTSWSCHW